MPRFLRNSKITLYKDGYIENCESGYANMKFPESKVSPIENTCGLDRLVSILDGLVLVSIQ